MAFADHTIHLDDDSEISRLLAAAGDDPLRFEANGVVYRVTRESDPWAAYDPERVRAAIAAVAGTLTPDEGEALKAYVYRAREEGSRPDTRP